MNLIFSTIGLLLISAGSTHAHIGHVGDVAGHAHWIGVGVIVVGGIAAAVLGTRKTSKDDVEDESEEPGEQQGEPA